MRRLRSWFLRLASLFRKQQHDVDCKEELQSHLQMHIDDNLRSGMSLGRSPSQRFD
jgi:macrolide transport system ATP-binding/permease protein